MKIKYFSTINFFLSFTVLLYFFYGYFQNENSAGAGGYDGDFKLIWGNLILLKQGIISNLDNPLYNDSRPPLSYIIHILLNPFTYNQEVFRLSNLIISSTIPFLLYFSIKQNYPSLDKNLIFLLALIVTLSPYFRTTAYWALGENYGLIFLLLSFLKFKNLEKNFEKLKNYKLFLNIFIICLLSSIVVYFDQKLVFLPFLVLILLFNLKIKPFFKFYSVILYFIFALPYFYLIYLWGSLIPPSAASAREVGTTIHLFHPGYCLTILTISIFPFIFAVELNLKKIKMKLLSKKFILIFILFFIYFIFSFVYGNFENLRIDGKGAFHKLSLVLFDNISIRSLITMIAFLASIVFTYLVFDKKIDLFIIFYFILISLFTFPFYQEYLDPLLYILIFTFFKTSFDLKKNRNVYLIFIYLLIFSIGSKFYYMNII